MNNKRQKHSLFGILEVSVLVILTCIISIGVGYFLGTKFSISSNENKNIYINRFIKNYKYIIENYYKKIDEKSLIDSAIKGMIDSLDDEYSSYIGENESNNFDITLNGSYEGLGITIAQNDSGEIMIANIVEHSPASKVDLKPLDQIIKINGKLLNQMSIVEVTKMIQKQKNKTFVLTIIRDQKEKEVTLKKESIELPSVSFKLYEKENRKIGYIKISIFALNTHRQFQQALQELENKKINSLIIDIRDNGGGHLISAKEITSEFLDSRNIIYQTEKKGKKEKFYSTGKKTKKYPVVILTNENSASGSELLASALKENNIAVTIGEKTYGKGTVQELVDLEEGGEYKVTIKKWLTPKGNWIDGKGIYPDIEIKQSEEYKKENKEENDSQLQRAIEYLYQNEN